MKATEVKVRPARRDDVSRIIDIERSWRHLSHWSVDAYCRLVDEGGYTSSFVAELEEPGSQIQIVGFVILHVVGDVSEIYNIAVERGFARCGIGKQLMSTAVEASKTLAAKTLILEVRKSNGPAIGFYRWFRFRIVGERRNYYSNPVEDAYVMSRDLE